VCGFDFEEFYGDIGIGYIEVHHIKPLNEISKEYIVDPFNDLRPICPNCHSMLHKANITVENLKDIIEKKRNIKL
jgi:5-methylcytosine-specific restriction protein A